MVEVRTCEEKVESDNDEEKRGEPKGIIEIEVAHEDDTQLACGKLAPTVKSIVVVYVIRPRATMYHLLKGLHEYLTRFAICSPLFFTCRNTNALTCRKDEFSVIIIGLDGAGKTVRVHDNEPDSNSILIIFYNTDSPREDQNHI